MPHTHTHTLMKNLRSHPRECSVHMTTTTLIELLTIVCLVFGVTDERHWRHMKDIHGRTTVTVGGVEDTSINQFLYCNCGQTVESLLYATNICVPIRMQPWWPLDCAAGQPPTITSTIEFMAWNYPFPWKYLAVEHIPVQVKPAHNARVYAPQWFEWQIYKYV